MPLIVPASGFGRNLQTTAKAGVTVTASGTTHTKGSWATLIDPVNFDVFGVFLNMANVFTAAANTSMLVDLGIAPTGGGSEQVVVANIDAGAADAFNLGGKSYFFPLFIPAGKALRARCQGFIASDTVTVVAGVYVQPPYGVAQDAPQEWETYGADTANSRGTVLSSGSGTFGTDVDITGGAGTIRDHRWFHVSIGWGANTAVSAGRYRVRLATDAGAADIIGIWEFMASSQNEHIIGPLNCLPVCYPVPAGSALRVDVDGGAAESMTAIVHAA